MLMDERITKVHKRIKNVIMLRLDRNCMWNFVTVWLLRNDIVHTFVIFSNEHGLCTPLIVLLSSREV